MGFQKYDGLAGFRIIQSAAAGSGTAITPSSGNLRRVFHFPIDNLRSLIKCRRVEEAATWSTFEGDLLERHFSFDNLIEHFEPT